MDATASTYPARHEKNLTTAETAQECYEMVKEEQKDDESINGMTWVKGGSKMCYAKFKVTHIISMCHKECDTCIFNGKFLSQSWSTFK